MIINKKTNYLLLLSIFISLLFFRSSLGFRSGEDAKYELVQAEEKLKERLKKFEALGLQVELTPLLLGSIRIQVKNIKKFIDTNKEDVAFYRKEIGLGKFNINAKWPFGLHVTRTRDATPEIKFFYMINQKFIKREQDLFYVGIGAGDAGPDFIILSKILLKDGNVKDIHLIDPEYEPSAYFLNFFKAADNKKEKYVKKFFFRSRNKSDWEGHFAKDDSMVNNLLSFVEFNLRLSLITGKEIDLYLHAYSDFYLDCLRMYKFKEANIGSTIQSEAPTSDLCNLLSSMKKGALFYYASSYALFGNDPWVKEITPDFIKEHCGKIQREQREQERKQIAEKLIEQQNAKKIREQERKLIAKEIREEQRKRIAEELIEQQRKRR